MTLQDWLARRTPPVPEGFREWMEPVQGEAPASSEALGREALEALDRALRPGDRQRRGAFDLLAADGFLTYAAEAALDGPDPEAELSALVRRVTG